MRSHQLFAISSVVFTCMGVVSCVGLDPDAESDDTMALEATASDDAATLEASEALSADEVPPPGCHIENTQVKSYLFVTLCDVLYQCDDGRRYWSGWHPCR